MTMLVHFSPVLLNFVVNEQHVLIRHVLDYDRREDKCYTDDSNDPSFCVLSPLVYMEMISSASPQYLLLSTVTFSR